MGRQKRTRVWWGRIPAVMVFFAAVLPITARSIYVAAAEQPLLRVESAGDQPGIAVLSWDTEGGERAKQTCCVMASLWT